MKHIEPNTPENLDDLERIKERNRHAYRLCVALATCRDEPETVRKLVQMAINDMPQESCADTAAVAKMLGATVCMLADYLRATGAALDKVAGPGTFDNAHKAGIRSDMMED